MRGAIDVTGINLGGLTTCPAESGVNTQPCGIDEIVIGAQNRAENAHLHWPSAYAIGIESGILVDEVHSVIIDIGCIYIITPNGKAPIRSMTSGFEFPWEFYLEARAEGFDKVTVGQVIARHMRGDHTDPHATLTGGKMSRVEQLMHGLIAAFAHI